MPADSHAPTLWLRATPLLFVVLWSTGFIGARLGLPYAEPLTFLALRMACAALLLAVVAVLMGAPWPRDRWMVGHVAVAGVLIQAVYLGGVFSAIATGMPVGLTALLMGLQPLLTALVAARWLGERATRQQWLGLALGLVGVALVLSGRLSGTVTAAGLALCALALCGLTLGTLYQKRYCAALDLRSGGAIQYTAAAAVMALGAMLWETGHIEWSGEFIVALVWLILVLSVGAIGLLYGLLRRGAAAKVASLFYLTPPFAAVFAYLLFDEALGPLAIAGMVVATLGVALVNWQPRRR